MTIVEDVVLEDHDVCYKEGLLQLRVVDVAAPYAAQREEALLELGIEVRGDEAGWGEAADDSS